MSAQTPFTPRGEELIQLYVAGELNEPEAGELLRIIEQDEPFARMMYDNVQMQILLERVARQRNTVDLWIEMDLLDDMPEAGKSRTITASGVKKESATNLAWAAAAVLIVFFSFSIWTEFRPKNAGPSETSFVSVAQIVECVDAVWKDGAVCKKGQELGLAKLELQKGIVQLRTKSKVDIVLEGPAEFVLRSGDETFFRTGRISVTVPQEGKGFKVVTPVATIVDLGTEFSITADDDKIDVQVVKGVVDVARSCTDKFQLTTGTAAVLDFQGETRHFQTDASTFFSVEAVRALWDKYVQGRRASWETEKQRRLEDRALLFSLGDGTVRGCREIEGSQPGSRAFRFLSRHDSIGISLPGEHRNLTMTAQVRIAGMENYNNTLCLGSDFLDVDGEFLWQLGNNGILRFHIRNSEVQRYDSGSVVHRNGWHTWILLAVVADADKGEIRHYVDGRLVAALPWKNPVPLKMPNGVLGNAPVEQRIRSSRFWNGDIDSFYVFSRVLSDAEIMDMYENTR